MKRYKTQGLPQIDIATLGIGAPVMFWNTRHNQMSCGVVHKITDDHIFVRMKNRARAVRVTIDGCRVINDGHMAVETPE